MSAANLGDKAGWFCICVDSLTDGIARGTVQGQFQPEPVKFCGLDHVIQIAEEVMNGVNFPQGFFHLRRFGKPERGGRDNTCLCHDHRLLEERTCQPFVIQHGKWVTFNVQILCRRNASWQGKATLFYNKKANVLHFRSALELTLAMRKVLTDIKI